MFRRLGEFFLDILEVVVFAIAIFLFIYLLVLQPHKIKGSSMEPNFLDGEYLLTDKVTYRFREPERGDIIVFEAPQTNGDEFIKRIIGLPGEIIMVKDDAVYINDTKLTETYIDPGVPTHAANFLRTGEAITIPDDYYAVLGDNRLASSDTRFWGFVGKDKIRGRAWVIYWPIPKVGVVKQATYNF